MAKEPLKIFWFDGVEVQGPVSGAELRELAFQQRVTPKTQIQLEGHGKWVDARKLKGLFANDGSVLPHPEETQKYLAKRQRQPSSPQPVASEAEEIMEAELIEDDAIDASLVAVEQPVTAAPVVATPAAATPAGKKPKRQAGEKRRSMSRLHPRLTIEGADAQLDLVDSPFVVLLKKSSLEIEFYRPGEADEQEPHDRDEVYVIAAGSGEFEYEGKRRPFQTGEVLYVPRGARHRFVNYSPDFATWVVFVNRSQPD